MTEDEKLLGANTTASAKATNCNFTPSKLKTNLK